MARFQYETPEEAYQAALEKIAEAQQVGAQELNFYKMGLEKIPPEVRDVEGLESLNLSNNHLDHLPEWLGELPGLKWLSLTNNHLTALPDCVGKLTNLKTLFVRGNKLEGLPDWLGNLTDLIRLDLSDNHITVLPDEIGDLTNLSELNLRYNQLSTLPDGIGKLTRLENLHLSYNNLIDLPEGFQHLSNLKTLSLSANKLKSLPDDFRNLTHLTNLSLYKNEFFQLPDVFQNMSNLSELDLRDNPNLDIPPELVEDYENPQAILGYIAEMQAKKGRRLNEAKIILVGQGAVGKTSLVKMLVEGDFDEKESMTPGVNITDWIIQDKAGKITVHLWDFGGQEIMHATHQFFLTHRSLYLLVLDSRQDEGENKLDYWMKTIEAYGGSSPVIVVANKADQRAIDLDKRGVLAKYRNVLSIVSTSCASGEGIDTLQEEIEAAITDMAHVRDLFPHSWLQVKVQIEDYKAKRNTMSYDHYVELCEDAGVEKPESQETLIGFLHDLGTVLNFRDEAPLANTQILNPEWVTKGVYEIINDDVLKDVNNGLLTPNRLKEILHMPGYNRPHEQQFITAMMRRFELSYTFQHEDGECHLIPSLLPKQGPDTGEWADSLAFEYHYDVLPPSLIARFIVRSYPLIKDYLYWRSGAVLEMGENQALVRADTDDRLIRIQVRGPLKTRRSLLGAVRMQLEAIHRSIPNLDVQQLVPIPGHPDILEDFQYLLDLEQMGVPAFVPRGLRQHIQVNDLLDGYESALTRQKRRGEDEFPEEGSPYPADMVFISYAHDDEAEVFKIHEAIGKRYSPWIDKRNILPGKTWEREIERAVKNAKAFVFCLSKNSFERRGVLQIEIKYALKELDKLLPQDVFIIPVRLDECDVPERLEHIQYLDWFTPDAETRLMQAIEAAVAIERG